MRIAFSTLGCPEWDLHRICEQGRAFGYDGVDFRGYGETLDVTRHPLFTDRAAETRARLADVGLTVSGLSSSIHVGEPGARADNLAEARRLVPVANDFDVTRIRLFGGDGDGTHTTRELARRAGETMRDIFAIDGAEHIRWLVETHDAWVSSRDCLTLLDELPTDNTGLVWDVAHTVRLADETPKETIEALGDRIEYVHLKDGIHDPDHAGATDDGYVFVPPGHGDLPIADAVRELDSRGYDGWVVFEHEKRWYPSLMDPDDAFAAFAEWFDSL